MISRDCHQKAEQGNRCKFAITGLIENYIKKLYSRVNLASGKLMTLAGFNIMKRKLSLKGCKPSLGPLAPLTFQILDFDKIKKKNVWLFLKVFFPTWMDRCSWGSDRRYLVASMLGTPGGAQARVTSLVPPSSTSSTTSP